MSEAIDSNRSRRRIYGWMLLGLIIISGLLFIRSRLGDNSRPLKPIRSTPTPISELEVDGEPVAIVFAVLNDNPAVLQNKRIRATGAFTGLTPVPCPDFKGPQIRWALIADELQLQAIGYEQILRLVAPGTELTVDGIWRYYDGPSGCGKAPPNASIWYLEVQQIVQPNPIVRANGGLGVGTLGSQEPASTAEPAEATPTPQLDATEVPVDTPATATPSPTATMELAPTGTASPTVTPVSASSATPGATGTTLTPTSPVPTVTRTPAAPTMTPISGGTSTPTMTPTATRLSDIDPTQTPSATSAVVATATPDNGYPGPFPNTATPESYP